MTSPEKYSLMSEAYVLKSVSDERGSIYIHNDTLPKEFCETMENIQFKLNESTGSFELDYNIMNDACIAVADVPFAELKKHDFVESGEYASVYTNARLAYLNQNNQEEITEIVKEIDSDIQTACAVWYDRMVATACEMIRDYILIK